MRSHSFITAISIGCWLALALVPNQVNAQMMGHNAKGDFGLLSASQPPPGWYLATMYYRYDGDQLRDRNGDSIAVDPEEQGEIDVNAYALGLWWVTDVKIFGANYSAMLFPAFTDNKLEVPILDIGQRTDTGLTDLYIQPINLGWHTDRADFMAGIGIFAPTGRYDAEASDNLGMGMWSFEIFGGTTLYFDKAKTWNFATTAFYEMHSGKEGSDMKVGDILTLEGGLGKSFMDGAINVGIAYYAQWKMSSDDFGVAGLPPDLNLGKNKVFGLGPDITIPIATKKKLIAMLNFRYFWESGARSSLEGNTFVVTASFPLPSVPLQ